MTPFSDQFFLTFIWSTILLTAEIFWNIRYFERIGESAWILTQLKFLIWVLMMGAVCYFMRNLLT